MPKERKNTPFMIQNKNQYKIIDINRRIHIKASTSYGKWVGMACSLWNRLLENLRDCFNRDQINRSAR